MSNQSFRARIRESINNETLQIALDNNTERRLKGRSTAFESIPDWRERRQRAHAIRADVIEHLDEYLAQFIAKNEENGVIVHRAKDAAEAIQIILNISGVRELAPASATASRRTPELWNEKREELADIAVKTLAEYFPALNSSIVARHIITPLDLEQTYGLTEGDLNHGQIMLDQFMFMRPIPGWSNHKTPIDNLYLCGSGVHGGGGVSGASGRNVVKVLK